MATKKPTHEEVIDGVRVRVYARRMEFEVLVGDGDIDDPEADVWCYPKAFGAFTSAKQAVLDQKQSQR